MLLESRVIVGICHMRGIGQVQSTFPLMFDMVHHVYFACVYLLCSFTGSCDVMKAS